jgi:Tol biopolymer transport system component
VPDHPEQIILTVPKHEERVTAAGQQSSDEIVGANILLVYMGGRKTPITEGRQFDLDPFVTGDGKFIFYSSDRQGGRIIWSQQMDGKGGIRRITGQFSTIDTEPAVSPDGSKLAFTSRPTTAMK